MEMKFYRCAHCGKIIAVVKESGVPVMCCGQKMEEIVPGTTDAAVEKHVPVYEVKDNIVTVCVGSVAHPMTEEHYIEWIAVAAEGKTIIKYLKPGEEPTKTFCKKFADHGTVYAYCNLHGLWKAEF